MAVVARSLAIRTRGSGFSDFTDEVARAVGESGIRDGICTLFIQHTSASLLIQENADPAVLRDLTRWLEKIAPESAEYEHDAEGPDDMPAHLRAALLSTSETIPVRQGRLALGTWQAIYLVEHRRRGSARSVELTILGE
jgi:secondary thiamine-phosphate synthase enzyme